MIRYQHSSLVQLRKDSHSWLHRWKWCVSCLQPWNYSFDQSQLGCHGCWTALLKISLKGALSLFVIWAHHPWTYKLGETFYELIKQWNQWAIIKAGLHLIRPEIDIRTRSCFATGQCLTFADYDWTGGDLRREFAQFLGPNIHASVILIDFSWFLKPHQTT